MILIKSDRAQVENRILEKVQAHLLCSGLSVSQGNVKVWMRDTVEMGLIDRLLFNPHEAYIISKQQTNTIPLQMGRSSTAFPHLSPYMLTFLSLCSEEDSRSAPQFAVPTPREDPSVPSPSKLPSSLLLIQFLLELVIRRSLNTRRVISKILHEHHGRL